MSQLPKIEGINETFWDDFGHPEDPNSFLYNSNLLMIRHAVSEENKYGIDLKAEGKEKNSEMPPDEVIRNRLHDCRLAFWGTQQAEICQNLMNEF